MAETYTYNLLLCKIKKELPQNNTDGSASYQIVVNKYDKSGNLVEISNILIPIHNELTDNQEDIEIIYEKKHVC